MPRNDSKRLTNVRFVDPPGDFENRGQRAMIFLKKIKNRTSPKLKPKPLTNGRFSHQKRISATGPKICPEMTQNALQMADLATPPGDLENRGQGTMIFLKKMKIRTSPN